jgi:nucleoid-associated protein YgaU
MKLKGAVSACIVALLLAGCATAEPVHEEAGADPNKAAMKAAAADLSIVLKALKDNDDGTAYQAFARALAHFNAAEPSLRRSLKDASDKLAKVVETGGFEYAGKESFSLLLVYLEMQTAYSDRDGRAMDELAARFDAACREAVQVTLQKKQRRMEELSSEIASRKEEIQKTTEPSVLETFPAVYTVKKGDTLPGISSRRDVYNDPSMWPLIYKANRDQIKDPKVLYAGQDLKIPRDMTVEEIVEARREAGAPDPEKIPKDAYTPKSRKK